MNSSCCSSMIPRLGIVLHQFLHGEEGQEEIEGMPVSLFVVVYQRLPLRHAEDDAKLRVHAIRLHLKRG